MNSNFQVVVYYIPVESNTSFQCIFHRMTGFEPTYVAILIHPAQIANTVVLQKSDLSHNYLCSQLSI